MKQTLALILALLCLLALCACGAPEETEPSQALPTGGESFPASSAVPSSGATLPATTEETPAISTERSEPAQTEPAEAFFAIETPWVTLRAPEEYESAVQSSVVSAEPYLLAFAAKDGTPLYTLHFNDETDELLGSLSLEDGDLALYAEFAKLDPNRADYNDCVRCQLGINTIIENLVRDYDFRVDELPIDRNAFAIETRVVTLQYPAKWQDRVTVDVSEERVCFSCGGTRLFDLLFTGQEGYLLGSYDGTPISVVTYDVDKTGRSEEELSELYAMQEQVNFIIQHLMADGKFVMAD